MNSLLGLQEPGAHPGYNRREGYFLGFFGWGLLVQNSKHQKITSDA